MDGVDAPPIAPRGGKGLISVLEQSGTKSLVMWLYPLTDKQVST